MSSQALEQPAQGGGGVIVPWNYSRNVYVVLRNMGLVGDIGGRWTVELDDLRHLFQH